jgi:hypothetical protein
MVFPSYKRPIEYINNKPYIVHSIMYIDRVKNATMVKEWLRVDTVFKVHSKGVYYFCEEIVEPEWEDVN